MFKKRAVVWVKLDSPYEWWPGQVENGHRPWKITFWSDESWEIVTQKENICRFDDTQKNSLILQGMKRFKAKSAVLSNFIKDVWMAEQKINGKLDDLHAYLSQASKQLKLQTKHMNEIKDLYPAESPNIIPHLGANSDIQDINEVPSDKILSSVCQQQSPIQLENISGRNTDETSTNPFHMFKELIVPQDEDNTLHSEKVSYTQHMQTNCLEEQQQEHVEICSEDNRPQLLPAQHHTPNLTPILMSTDSSVSLTPNENKDLMYEELSPFKPATEVLNRVADDTQSDESSFDCSDYDSDFEPDTEEPDSEDNDSDCSHNQRKNQVSSVLPFQNKNASNRKILHAVCTNTAQIPPNKLPEENYIPLWCANSSKKENGKRIYDKCHSCYFCGKEVSKLARHILGAHKNEVEVASVAALEVGSLERKRKLETILRLGDYYHNMEILAAKQGTIIPLRRPSEEEAKRYTYKDYGPCPDCLGFVVMKDLYRHSSRCPSNSKATDKGFSDDDDEDEGISKKERRRVKNESILLMLPALTSIHEQGFQELLASMHADAISHAVKSDPLIQQLGYHLYEKFNNTQKNYVSQTMRMMGRYLLTLREQENRPLLSLESFLDTSQFDKLISAIHVLCKGKAEKFKRFEMGIPSLALKIGYNLRKSATILKGKALRSKDYVLRTKADDFLQLFDLEWTGRISSAALNTLHTRKNNKPVELPLTSDLMALCKYQTDQLVILIQKLNEAPQTDAWYRLAEMTLSRLLVFNKRRVGEVSKIFLSDYINMPNWSGTRTQEMEQGLSSLEKRLCDTLCLLEIKGKRQRKVPVIIPPDVKKALDALVAHRNEVGVSKNNPYLFARPYFESEEHLQGSHCLYAIKSRIKLKHPERITGTKLRKYIATVVQVFNLKEAEVDWLARHLGHDIRVHREYYRLHESTAELTKVSRLLMAVDSGQASKWAGKSLQDINLDDLPVTDEVEKNQLSSSSRPSNPYLVKPSKSTKRSTFNQREETDFTMTDDGDEPLRMSDSENECFNSSPKRKASRIRRKTGLVLSSQQKIFIIDYFKISIRKHKPPGKIDCEKCIKANPKLFSNLKDYLPIKWCVNNHIVTCRRQMTKV